VVAGGGAAEVVGAGLGADEAQALNIRTLTKAIARITINIFFIEFLLR
jgi:hypothetical protein